jgi:hypothetical protein
MPDASIILPSKSRTAPLFPVQSIPSHCPSAHSFTRLPSSLVRAWQRVVPRAGESLLASFNPSPCQQHLPSYSRATPPFFVIVIHLSQQAPGPHPGICHCFSLLQRGVRRAGVRRAGGTCPRGGATGEGGGRMTIATSTRFVSPTCLRTPPRMTSRSSSARAVSGGGPPGEEEEDKGDDE